jgi:hypothetical protein
LLLILAALLPSTITSGEDRQAVYGQWEDKVSTCAKGMSILHSALLRTAPPPPPPEHNIINQLENIDQKGPLTMLNSNLVKPQGFTRESSWAITKGLLDMWH